MTIHRPALDVLAELRRGKTAHELSEKLADLITACVDTGKKGELLLKLTLEPDPDDESRMKVTDQIAVKAPRRTERPSLFFIDGGTLTRRDPNQDPIPGSHTDDTTVPEDDPVTEPTSISNRRKA